jgi:hypothetical protein
MTYTYLQELAETGQISLSQTSVSKLLGQVCLCVSLSQTSVSKLLGQVSTYHTLTLVCVYQYQYQYTCDVHT